MPGWKHSTCKQEGGDDGYCYVIRDKRTGKVILNGLHRSECKYYRDRHEQEVNKWLAEQAAVKGKL
jgi:hypothetical protein